MSFKIIYDTMIYTARNIENCILEELHISVWKNILSPQCISENKKSEHHSLVDFSNFYVETSSDLKFGMSIGIHNDRCQLAVNIAIYDAIYFILEN